MEFIIFILVAGFIITGWFVMFGVGKDVVSKTGTAGTAHFAKGFWKANPNATVADYRMQWYRETGDLPRKDQIVFPRGMSQMQLTNAMRQTTVKIDGVIY